MGEVIKLRAAEYSDAVYRAIGRACLKSKNHDHWLLLVNKANVLDFKLDLRSQESYKFLKHMDKVSANVGCREHKLIMEGAQKALKDLKFN